MATINVMHLSMETPTLPRGNMGHRLMKKKPHPQGIAKQAKALLEQHLN
jgi:hypothetical protein